MKKVLIVFIIISVALAGYVGIKRHGIESSYRSVEVILDYTEIVTAVSSAGVDISQYLRDIKEAGASAISFEEDTIGSMQARGEVLVLSMAEAKMNLINNPFKGLEDIWGSVKENAIGTFIVSLTDDAKEYLSYILPIRMESYIDFVINSNEESLTAYIPMGKGSVESMNIGFDFKLVSQYEEMGFNIAARPSNSFGITESWIEYIIDTLDNRSSVTSIVFRGQEVLGYPHNIDKVASKILESDDMCVADVEFTVLQGLSEMTIKSLSHIARMHSITREEMNKGMDSKVALERYVRAVRERGIRLIYFRPFSPPNAATQSSLYEDVEFMADLKSNLVDAGFEVGSVKLLEQIDLSTLFVSILVLGIAAAFMLTLLMLFNSKSFLFLLIPLVSAAGYFAVISTVQSLADFGIKVVSLASAVVFPTLAITYAVTRCGKQLNFEDKDIKISFMLGKSTKTFFVTCIIGLVGGLITAASMTTSSYIMNVDQFNGVKIMYIIPVIFTFVVYWISYVKKPDETYFDSLKNIVNSPVLFWHVFLVGSIAVLGMMMIVRTGNDTASSVMSVGVSSFELQVRAFLERTFVIRPRSKELFIGHPALLLLGGLITAKDKFFVLPVALLSLIGLVSMVNTFAHIHTPIAISMIRSVIGIGLGYLVGVIAVVVFAKITKKKVSKVG